MNLTIKENNVPPAIAETINKNLAQIEESTRAFDRNNSQTTLTHMSLTMLTGQSPMRMLRQTLAEIDKRKMALNEAQYNLAKKNRNIKTLQEKDNLDEVEEAKLRMLITQAQAIENKANGALKDIATLIDAHNAIKNKNNINEWDEATFEAEEKKFHVRRGFELMYKNIMVQGRPADSTIEYMQQYGVHPQVAIPIITGYIEVTNKRIAEKDIPHSNELEKFLDDCAEQFYEYADKTTERIFGKTDITNQDYMLRIEK